MAEIKKSDLVLVKFAKDLYNTGFFTLVEGTTFKSRKISLVGRGLLLEVKKWKGYYSFKLILSAPSVERASKMRAKLVNIWNTRNISSIQFWLSPAHKIKKAKITGVHAPTYKEDFQVSMWGQIRFDIDPSSKEIVVKDQ
jgi:hypothetical protein